MLEGNNELLDLPGLSHPSMFECSASLLLHLKAGAAVVDREKHSLPQELDAGEERLTVW